MLKRILCCAVLLILTGCMTVGPDYKRPVVDTPAAWRFEEKEARDLANTVWWQQFNDPVLNGLVSTALEQNKDLLIATARIEEFFGRYFSTRGDQFPSAGGNADAFRQRLSERNASVASTARTTPTTSTRHSSTPAGRSTSGASTGGRPRRRAPSCLAPRRPGAPWC